MNAGAIAAPIADATDDVALCERVPESLVWREVRMPAPLAIGAEDASHRCSAIPGNHVRATMSDMRGDRGDGGERIRSDRGDCGCERDTYEDAEGGTGSGRRTVPEVSVLRAPKRGTLGTEVAEMVREAYAECPDLRHVCERVSDRMRDSHGGSWNCIVWSGRETCFCIEHLPHKYACVRIGRDKVAVFAA